MSPTSLQWRPHPQLEELHALLQQLKALREELTKREQSLAAAQAGLTTFEQRYLREVGLLCRTLDDWEDKLAQLLNDRDPEATSGNRQAADSHAGAGGETQSAPQDDIATPQQLRALYRDVARHLHPDRACDDADAIRRHHLMALANAAYARADRATLERMLHGAAAPTFAGDAVPDRVVQMLHAVRQVQLDLRLVEQQHAELVRSQIAVLQASSVAAAAAGRDLLQEMAARVRGSIGAAMARYEREQARPASAPARPRVEELVTAELPFFRGRFNRR